jgi:hypothetical protein
MQARSHIFCASTQPPREKCLQVAIILLDSRRNLNEYFVVQSPVLRKSHAMSKGSKNNPEARGKATVLRKHNGKTVKPVLFIKSGVGRYIAAAYEDGTLAVDKNTNMPLAYKSV